MSIMVKMCEINDKYFVILILARPNLRDEWTSWWKNIVFLLVYYIHFVCVVHTFVHNNIGRRRGIVFLSKVIALLWGKMIIWRTSRQFMCFRTKKNKTPSLNCWTWILLHKKMKVYIKYFFDTFSIHALKY